MSEGRVTSDIEFEATDLTFQRPSLENVIAALQKESATPVNVISSTLVYGMSDLSEEDCREIEDLWQLLPSTFKHQFLRALNEASETLYELNFREIATFSLDDPSPMVRAMAIELLWTDESTETMRRLIDLAKSDPDHSVRASALKALGKFVLLGEYGEVPQEIAKEAQDLALHLHQDLAEPLDVRRRALEALSNSSLPNVTALIRAAYTHGNHDLKISAIFAMGRSCNSAWRGILMDELASDDYESLYEAINACGQLQLSDSVPRIGELTLRDDSEIQMMAVWALGEIGGKQAFDILTSLAETDQDEALELAIDEALDSAGFSLTLPSFGFGLEDDY